MQKALGVSLSILRSLHGPLLLLLSTCVLAAGASAGPEEGRVKPGHIEPEAGRDKPAPHIDICSKLPDKCSKSMDREWHGRCEKLPFTIFICGRGTTHAHLIRVPSNETALRDALKYVKPGERVSPAFILKSSPISKEQVQALEKNVQMERFKLLNAHSRAAIKNDT